MQSPLSNNSGTAAVVRILRLSQELRRHPSVGYLMAFVSMGLAGGLQWLAQDQYAGAPFLTIYPAMILTTLVGGLGPGFLSAALAAALQWGLFIPTLHWFALASYAIDATVAVLLIAFINRTLNLLLINIDQEKRAKQHQYLLAAELNHRIQNLLTVIQAVIRFSLPGDGMVQASAVQQRLMDRPQSMSAANRAITDSTGDGVRLADLINGEIHGFESQFEISGAARLLLGPQMTQNLSLILQELVTNALKHGALSVANGWVSLRLEWSSTQLTFSWEERDGPPVLPVELWLRQPDPRNLCQKICRSVEACYGENGLRYVLQINSDQIRRAEPVAVTPAAPAPAAPRANVSEARPPRSWLGQTPAHLAR